MPFDFGIFNSSNKLLGLIEYQGGHHYLKVKWNKNMTELEAERRLKKVQHHDKLKMEFCQKNNIPFLAIHYQDNVSAVLSKFITRINY
jgi:hypothetical protein